MSRRIAQPLTLAAGVLLTAVACGAWWIESHRAPAVPTIAFIPQTAGALLWDVEHLGATVAAEELKCHLYWNAPTPRPMSRARSLSLTKSRVANTRASS